MLNSATMMLSLFGLAPSAALQTRGHSYSINEPLLPTVRLPKIEMKKDELLKKDPSLPDWVVMSGDMGLMLYRVACCPQAGRARQ
jgi:hypothetical protein